MCTKNGENSCQRSKNLGVKGDVIAETRNSIRRLN